MNEILHANIFFIIASVATVVFCVMVCFILFHVLKIVRSVRIIVERIESASHIVAEDASQLRAFITEGSIIARMFNFMSGGRPRRKSSRRKKDDE